MSDLSNQMSADGGIAIRVVDVWHHYGVKPVLRGVSMDVRRGELLALMGPNGMGKSTLLGVMAGALSPYKGYVEVEGLRRRSTEEAELAIRRKVVYLPASAWTPSLSGRQFLVVVGRLYDIPEERIFDHVDRLLKLFDLEEVSDKYIENCSTGQRKKFALASALITEAPILLLDEPFSGGLDPSGIQALKEVLKRLAARDDVTVVMATPVPELVEELADRVAIIRDGQLVALDSIEGLRKSTGSEGPLQNALEKVMRPEGHEHIRQYFKESGR